MIKYDERGLRSGLRLCSGFFNFKVRISCLSNMWVLLFYFYWSSRLFLLMYAFSLLCASIFWNNIGNLGVYWYVLYSALMEAHQKLSGLLLQDFLSLQIIIITLVIGREFEQCSKMASSRHWI